MFYMVIPAYSKGPKIMSYSLNRRSYDRYIVDDSATLLLDNTREQPLILHDVSSRGVSVIGDYPFKDEATVKVILRTSLFDKPMFKTANVAW